MGKQLKARIKRVRRKRRIDRKKADVRQKIVAATDKK